MSGDHPNLSLACDLVCNLVETENGNTNAIFTRVCPALLGVNTPTR